MALGAVALTWLSVGSAARAQRPADAAEGLAMEFAVDEPEAVGASAIARLQITDAASGRPVPSLHPHVWLSARRSEQVAAETSCEAKARAFASGQLTSRADADLNGYLLVTLNHDDTVSFLNPQVSWRGSRLEGIVQLPGAGLDWALSADGSGLYVTLPDLGKVAVIDTVARSLLAAVDTGSGGRPSRLAVSPRDGSIWVGLDDSPYVAVIDPLPPFRTQRVETGPGLHQLGFTGDGETVFVTNTGADTVSLLDAMRRTKRMDIPAGRTPLNAVWSSLSGRIYVGAVNDDRLRVIDPRSGRVEAEIAVDAGVVNMAVQPGGRFLWTVAQTGSKVQVVDTATHRVIAGTGVTARADQIAFTPRFAYLRALQSEKFTMIQLAQLEKAAAAGGGGPGQLAITEIQAGRRPPAALPSQIGVAPMIAPLPGEDGVVVANAPDRMLYYYAEGAMAPMGTLDNHKRAPRALLVQDGSLRQSQPGFFTAPLAPLGSGRYDVVVMIDRPRHVRCLTVDLKGSREPTTARSAMVKVEAIAPSGEVRPHSTSQVTIRLRDAVSGSAMDGAGDVRLLVFEPPGLWQQRLWMQAKGGGVYAAEVRFPHPGSYHALVESPSAGLQFTDSPRWQIRVVEAAGAATAAIK